MNNFTFIPDAEHFQKIRAKKYNKKYREKNIEEIKEQKKLYYQKNKKSIEQKTKEWRINNQEKYIKNNKKYYEKNKEKIKKYHKEWKKNNPNKVKNNNITYYKNNKTKIYIKNRKYLKETNYFSKYQKNRLNIDINFKLRRNLRKRIWDALKGNCKSKKTLDLLGCDLEFLKQHLESQFDSNMSWDNYGSYWHIDHIRPCASFDLTDIEQQKICFYYSNLQPLEKIENIRKGKKIA